MGIAKARKQNPMDLARKVQIAMAEIAREDPHTFEIGILYEAVPPGFFNFRLEPLIIGSVIEGAAAGRHCFFVGAAAPRTIVIDFSSPNVAKPMHVGHIRSTILGDCLARVCRLLGHRVVTDNHIGDWGTQFGMLLIGWKRDLDRAALERDPIAELERIYKKVSAECKADEQALEAARLELVKLQGGDAENLGIWREMQRLSQVQFDTIYARLGVKFDHTLGESFYNPRLQGVVDDLMARGLAHESDGAKAIFTDGATPPKDDPFRVQRDGEWADNPALIQKSDGGFNYATTDLATLAYRMETWSPDEIIYVTDGRQQLHFRQIFAAFRRWRPEAKVRLEHVWFGSILGEDGKPFKTRSGDTVKLADLLDEAEERALAVVREKNASLPEDQQREIARIVGLGAVKYADLLPNRQSDYMFSWDKMLSLQGNTAPYLQYAYTRIRSIFRKSGIEAGAGGATVTLNSPEELALARHLLNFGLVLEAVAEECRPNFLCNYLYDLAGFFARFYEACPVLKAADAERASRLALCDATARVLRTGLEALGIETTETM
jgi:arginyl-tRNA synthetase